MRRERDEKKTKDPAYEHCVSCSRLSLGVRLKRCGSCSTVLSVQFIYFIYYVSEFDNLSANALWSFQPSVCFCCGFIIGGTALTCLKQTSRLSRSLDAQFCKHQSVPQCRANNLSGGSTEASHRFNAEVHTGFGIVTLTWEKNIYCTTGPSQFTLHTAMSLANKL